ncbi:hypothetical protein CEXT_47721 [Caerostris extrusa]|uniref:Uncharacterized protein n=1 Tax=Caerostris extrusa TaxID=172846 RepID=A0AAV4W2I0_CAEEX|nr:hypothetical protein CEXT_47721 [Caerostris extrusa]
MLHPFIIPSPGLFQLYPVGVLLHPTPHLYKTSDLQEGGVDNKSMPAFLKSDTNRRRDCKALVYITLGPGKTKPRKNEAELNVHISMSRIEHETENPFYVLLKKGANSLEKMLECALQQSCLLRKKDEQNATYLGYLTICFSTERNIFFLNAC